MERRPCLWPRTSSSRGQIPPGLTPYLCSCVTPYLPKMFFPMISATSPRTACSGFAWLHALGNSCYLWLSLECILPFGKIVLGTPISASRPKSHHSPKEKKKALDPNCVGLQCLVPWGGAPTPQGRDPHSGWSICTVSPGAGPLREVSCLLHAAFVSPCPRREVNCSFIPSVWACHLFFFF